LLQITLEKIHTYYQLYFKHFVGGLLSGDEKIDKAVYSKVKLRLDANYSIAAIRIYLFCIFFTLVLNYIVLLSIKVKYNYFYAQLWYTIKHISK